MNVFIALKGTLFYFYLVLHKNVCCGYSLESPGRGDSNEYPQCMFIWKNMENYPFIITEYPPCLFLWMIQDSSGEQIKWVFDNLGIIPLFLHKNICCGYSLELPHRGDSNMYLQHMFIWKIMENYPSIIIKYPPYLFLWMIQDLPGEQIKWVFDDNLGIISLVSP